MNSSSQLLYISPITKTAREMKKIIMVAPDRAELRPRSAMAKIMATSISIIPESISLVDFKLLL